jgi:hypothetical protein
MARMKRICGIGMAVLLLALSVAAQTSVEKELQDTSQELVRLYTLKDWTGALRVINRQLELAGRLGDAGVRAGILYNKACVHALAGDRAQALAAVRASIAAGYAGYDRFESDTDFDSLRADPEFKAAVAGLKARFVPRPLEWDRAQALPEFTIRYDAPGVKELREMRREFAIDDVVAGAKDDYDRLCRLTRWTSGRWPHSPDQTASKSDPVTILREAQKGGRFICRDYAIVLAGAASAYGWPARVINLLPRDVETRSEAHAVAEVWLEQFHKWVLADGQYGIVAELEDRPLNAVELQAAFAADRPVTARVGAEALPEWKPFILRNAYYFKTGDDQRAFVRKTERQLVLVPRGASEPHRFGGGNENVFEGCVYTSDPAAFYAPPPGARGPSIL